MFKIFKRKAVIVPAEAITFQPEPAHVTEEVIDLTPAMEIKPESKPIVMITSTWDPKHCATIGCSKALEGCCTAYHNPAMLSWFRQGKECPTGPYQSTVAKRVKKVNPIKASKRKTK